MNFVDYLNLIRRRLPLVGAVVGVVSLISLGMSMREMPSYEAALRLRTRQIAPLSAANSFLEEQGLQSDLATESQLIASDKVASIVAENLQLPGRPGDLLGMVDVFAVQGTAIIAITTQAATPQFAMDVANAFADAYLQVRRAEASQVMDQAIKQASRGLAEAQQRLSEADQRLAAAPPGSSQFAEAEAERGIALAEVVGVRSLLRDLADRSALETGFGEVISPADEATLVKSSSPTRSVTFGALLGIPLALAIVLLLDSMSETVRSVGDAEAVSGADVLGMIPFDDRIASYGRGKARGRGAGRRDLAGTFAVDTDPFSIVSEAYRTASLNLATAAHDFGAKTILMTSALAGEGKTTTLCNLAGSTSEREIDTLVVDADLRRPAAHAVCGGDPEPGLAEVVLGRITPRQAIQPLRPNFGFVSSGAPVERPDQMLTRINLGQVIAKFSGPERANGNGARKGARAAKTQKAVFIDSAPILQAAETLALAQAADAVVLVVRAGVTRKQAVARAVEQVYRAGGRLLGVILVGVSNEAHLGLAGSSPRDSQRILSLVRSGESVGAGVG